MRTYHQLSMTLLSLRMTQINTGKIATCLACIYGLLNMCPVGYVLADTLVASGCGEDQAKTDHHVLSNVYGIEKIYGVVRDRVRMRQSRVEPRKAKRCYWVACLPANCIYWLLSSHTEHSFEKCHVQCIWSIW